MGDDLRTLLVVGPRLLAGWACAAVAVLDLSMGIDTGPGTTDGSYLLFHLVLLLGGLLLLGLGRLPRNPTPTGYAVTCALAVPALVLTALPSTRNACCLRSLEVRHGYPLTLLAWDQGQTHHFAPAHAFADLVFWLLTGLILLTVVTQLRPRPRPTPNHAAPTHTAPNHAEARAFTEEQTPTIPDTPAERDTAPEQATAERDSPAERDTPTE